MIGLASGHDGPTGAAPGGEAIDGSRFDGLVLDGRSRGSLAVTRSLGRSGYTVAVATRGLPTRYAHERAVMPPISADVERFVGVLIGWLRRHPTDVVLTSTDGGVAALSLARDRIERTTAVGLGSNEALSISSSKSKTLERAVALGIPMPRSVVVDRPGEVVAAVREIGLPCVVKPDRSWTGRSAHNERLRTAFVWDEEAAREAALRLVGPESPALVQEFAPRRREAIMLFQDRGRVRARFAMDVSRTWPPLGGNSVMRTSIRPPEDSLSYAERLVADIALDGYSEVEFRRSVDGRPLLMEINPRFSQSIELAILSGVDFPGMQVEWARGRQVPEAAGYREGVRLSWFEGELFTLFASVLGRPRPAPSLQRTLASLVRDYVTPPHLDGLLVSDPLPMISQLRASVGAYRREASDGKRRGSPSASSAAPAHRGTPG